jgi:hypothetical protein
MSRTAFFCVDAPSFMQFLLPPGNEIVGWKIYDTGALSFEMRGIDVPLAIRGETPRVHLMCGAGPDGNRMFWFEAPAPRDPVSQVAAAMDGSVAPPLDPGTAADEWLGSELLRRRSLPGWVP